MKKLLALLLCAWMLVSVFAACGGREEKIALTRSYTFSGVSLKLPDGFTVTNKEEGYSVAANKETGDYVAFVKAEADHPENYTEEAVKSIYIEKYGDAIGETLRFEKRKIDGFDAFVVSGRYSDGKKDNNFISVSIFMSDKTATITYNGLSGTFDDAFARSVDGIRITK